MTPSSKYGLVAYAALLGLGMFGLIIVSQPGSASASEKGFVAVGAVALVLALAQLISVFRHR